MIVGICRLGQLVRISNSIDSACEQHARQLASDLKVTRRFELRTGPSQAMPMACWWGRWVIVVPEDFARWPEVERRTVLAHELGHVARRDAWSDFFTQLVCRVAWPHPLFWLAARSVLRLRERACDEWVILTGQFEPHSYGRQLLDVVARCQPMVPELAPSMARSHDLESRLKHLLRMTPRKAANHSVSKLCILVACLSTAGILAAGQPVKAPSVDAGEISTEAAVQPQGDRSAVQLTKEPTPASPAITVRGTVVNESGEPVSGAEVVLRAKLGGLHYSHGLTHTRDILARTKTDAAGAFALQAVGIPARMSAQIESLKRGAGGAELFCWADGRGLAWLDISELHTAEPVHVTLAPEAIATGVIRDEEGRGLPQARISLLGVTSTLLGRFDEVLRQPGDVSLICSELQFSVVTDANGRFTLRNLPQDRRLPLLCEKAGVQPQCVILDTNPNNTETEIPARRQPDVLVRIVRTPFELATKPTPHVMVRVSDHEGRPVSDGVVGDYVRTSPVDEQGCVLLNVGTGNSVRLHYGSDPLSPRLNASVTAEIAEDQQPQTVEIRLPEPRWLTGRVIDADSGRPVIGVHLDFSNGVSSQAISREDGRFRIPVVAGDGLLRFSQDAVHGYLVPRYDERTGTARIAKPVGIHIPAEGVIEPVTLKLARGLVVRGVVRDTNGQAVVGATVRALNNESPYLEASQVTNAQGRFELGGSSPHVSTDLIVSSDSGNTQQLIEAVPDQPWDQTRFEDVVLTLSPGITLKGRILKDGQPLEGVTMELSRSSITNPGRYRRFAETKTDAEGRYAVSGLARGDGYRFDIIAPDNAIAPGWPHQSPYIQKVPYVDRDVIELPDAHLLTRNQSLRGIVVNPHGEPVPGITVSASLVSGEILSRPRVGPSPWEETDEQGQFSLEFLPDKPIKLRASKANPAGGRTRYPATLQPTLNQQDIRIVLDPRLDAEVEDLD